MSYFSGLIYDRILSERALLPIPPFSVTLSSLQHLHEASTAYSHVLLARQTDNTTRIYEAIHSLPALNARLMLT